MTWLKLAPWLAIALLAAVVLWLRGDVIAARAEKKAAETQVVTLIEANQSLKRDLDLERQKRVDNDAIAMAVADRIAGNQVREVHTRETIREVIRDDPQAAAWADTAVPDGVRAGLRAGQVDPPPR